MQCCVISAGILHKKGLFFLSVLIKEYNIIVSKIGKLLIFVGMESKPVILVDSKCALCNRSVSFILKKGGSGKFRILSLYDRESSAILSDYGLPENYKKSIVFIEGGKVYLRSDAVLQLTKNLNGIFPKLYCLKIIPRFVRDAIYNLISGFRHEF